MTPSDRPIHIWQRPEHLFSEDELRRMRMDESHSMIVFAPDPCPQRSGGRGHSWTLEAVETELGIRCTGCGELRAEINGRVIQPGRAEDCAAEVRLSGAEAAARSPQNAASADNPTPAP
ncbi:MAG: hypothetical protein QM598_05620 [Protaetiibacter sp.]